ncbi:MAG: hypothetical protein KatS3mg059_1340 [Thermomicrobiales bacterium]|nr:MAG: hypothetical protein KatS3mg059_1340 [Thermomicrobiales bacterium]
MSRGRARSDDPGEMTIELFAPGMTPLHRVGLAGLAMTLEALKQDPEAERLREMGEWDITDRGVHLRWKGSGEEFLRRLLQTGLRITEEGLIWFPALGHPLDAPGQAVALHNALLSTFLQHAQSRKTEKQTKAITLEVDEQPLVLTYAPVLWYQHQRVAIRPGGALGVAGWLYPGGVVRHFATGQATALMEPAERALALVFAPVGALYFEVHRRTAAVRPGYCVVLPEVESLPTYTETRRLFLRQSVKALHVAGTSEAAARVLSEIEAQAARRTAAVPRCQVVAFGTAAWSKQQKSRVEVFAVESARREGLEVYRRAAAALPPRLIATQPDPKTGEVRRYWRVPQTPDLVARNVVSGKPWWWGFSGLWESLREGANPNERAWVLSDEREGLHAMVTETQTMGHGPEARLVQACHEAWRRRLGELSEQAKTQGADFNSLAQREYERVRISFARCKNAAMLRQTLTDFWSRAGTLPSLQESWAELLPLLKDRWQEARDLALLALASYRGEERMQAGVDQQV